MKSFFSYSILQYKHSLALTESVNVGVLFHFYNEDILHFEIGDVHRVKAIYPSFDTTLFTIISKSIKSKIGNRKYNLFDKQSSFSFKDFIFKNLIVEDSTSLQFSELFNVVDAFGDPKKNIEQICKILLPDVFNTSKIENRHNEDYLIKRFSDNLVKRNIVIKHKFTIDKTVKVKGLELTFNYAWKNGSTHLVKPISFDLKDQNAIQTKSVNYFGNLTLLRDYANQNDYTFDLLISKPQEDKFASAYEDALEIIYQADSPKNLITEDKLDSYSDDTASILLSKEL